MSSDGEKIFDTEYRLNDWLYTTPIFGMFNGDNAHILSAGSFGVLIPQATKETTFEPAHANKVVTFGLLSDDGVVIATDSHRAGFLVSQFRLRQGLDDETLELIGKMDTPTIAVIDHKVLWSLNPIPWLQEQFLKRNIGPFMKEYPILPEGSADAALMNWKGRLILNTRQTGNA